MPWTNFLKIFGGFCFGFNPHESRHSHTISLHGDLGRVIFGQDIHAIIEYLCERVQQVWFPNENWRYGAIERPFSAAKISAVRTPHVGAVINSSRSRSSLWISTQIVSNFHFNTKKWHKIMCTFYFIRNVVVASKKVKNLGNSIIYTYVFSPPFFYFLTPVCFY